MCHCLVGKTNFVLIFPVGANHRLQRKLKRNLVLIGCLLHAVEKVWQRYFLKLEGLKTTCPKYTGPVGRNFSDGLTLRPIVENLMAIPGNVKKYAKDFIDSMNTDTKLLYELCLAIQEGKFSDSLANRKPGKCHQAR